VAFTSQEGERIQRKKERERGGEGERGLLISAASLAM